MPDERRLGGYLDELMEALRKHLGRALHDGRPSAVHHARVTTRRLAAALDITAPLLPKKPLRDVNNSLKCIRKSLGDVRDLDVMQEHLRELKSQKQAAARVLRYLQAKRRALARALRDGQLEKCTKSLESWPLLKESLVADTTPLLLAAVREPFADFARRADALSAALASGAKRNQQIQPHALRIAGRSLRYALGMAEVESLPVGSAAKRYKRMQDALGLWHDHHVLAQQILKIMRRELREPGYRGDAQDMLLFAARALRRGDASLQRFATLWRRHRDPLIEEITRLTGGATAKAR